MLKAWSYNPKTTGLIPGSPQSRKFTGRKCSYLEASNITVLANKKKLDGLVGIDIPQIWNCMQKKTVFQANKANIGA